MLNRNYGIGISRVSVFYGIVYLISATFGALLAIPATSILGRYYKQEDAPVILLLLTSIIAFLPALIGPLMPTFQQSLGCFFVSMSVSAMQTSIAFSTLALVTPSQSRGIVISAYMITMNLTGGAFGSVIIGLLSDHFFGSTNLRYAMSLMAGIAVPASILCFIYLRPRFRYALHKEGPQRSETAEAI